MYHNNAYKQDDNIADNLENELLEIEARIQLLQERQEYLKERKQVGDYPILAKTDTKGASTQTDFDEITTADGSVLFTNNELYYTLTSTSQKNILWEYKESYSRAKAKELHEAINSYPKDTGKYHFQLSNLAETFSNDDFNKVLVHTLKWDETVDYSDIDSGGELISAQDSSIAYVYNASENKYEECEKLYNRDWQQVRTEILTKLKSK